MKASIRTPNLILLEIFCLLLTTNAISPFIITPDPINSFYFVPKFCSSYNFQGSCSQQALPGCACYSTGSCQYQNSGNECTHCRTPNTVSYNPGENCPNIQGQRFSICAGNRPASCPPAPAGKQVCECNDQGSCQYVPGDLCNSCRKQDILSAIDADCSIFQQKK